MNADLQVKKAGRHAGFYVLLLGASLLAQVWVVGLWVFVLTPATLLHISVLLLVFGLFVLAGLNPLCRLLFRLRPVPEWMETMAARHAQVLSIARPQLYQFTATGINAFALSGTGRAGVILFHPQIIKQLTQDEIEAVIAHELAHLSERHSSVMTFLQGMAMPLVVPVALLVGTLRFLLPGKCSFRLCFVNAYSLCSVVFFPLTGALIALVSRHWEYRADAIAARLVGTHRYISTLRCLHGMFFQHPDMLSITVMTARSARRDEWILSHPGLGARIEALRQTA